MGAKVTTPPSTKFKQWSAAIVVSTTVVAGATNIDIDSTLATVDGFLVCVVEAPTISTKSCAAFGYTDSANPPTTKKGACSIAEQDAANIFFGSYVMPVIKGNYYKATWYGVAGDNAVATRTYYFLSIDI